MTVPRRTPIPTSAADRKLPEIAVVGICADSTSSILTRIAEEVRNGRQFDDVHEFENVLANRYRCRFRKVSKKLKQNHLGTAICFYQGAEFPALQAFIPDSNGRFPWDGAFQGNALAQFFERDPLRTRTTVKRFD